MSRIPIALIVAAALFVAGGVLATAQQRDPEERTVWNGVFTEEQAARGAITYAITCARCHGAELEGGNMQVKALAGEQFWRDIPRLLATATLARSRGMTVLATTRNPNKTRALEAVGVDHVIIDTGIIAPRVRAISPLGVDAALELIGTPTLPDTLRSTRVHGVVCFTGMLSNEWTVKDFYPIAYLPRGVRLTAYHGEASDLPPEVLQEFLDAVAAGRISVPVHHRYALDDIVEAHTEMEAGRASGKLVVTT